MWDTQQAVEWAVDLFTTWYDSPIREQLMTYQPLAVELPLIREVRAALAQAAENGRSRGTVAEQLDALERIHLEVRFQAGRGHEPVGGHPGRRHATGDRRCGRGAGGGGGAALSRATQS